MKLRGVILLVVLLAALSFAALAQQHFLSEASDGTFYFFGTIGRTLEVEMALAKHGSQLEGSYVYANHRRAIPLRGKVTKAYEYELDEVGTDGAVAGHFKISDATGAGAAIGTWEGAERSHKLTVVLSEIKPEQHQLLQKTWDTKPQIISLIAGFDHVCALRSMGAVCWGSVPLMPGVALGGPEMTAYRALPNLLIDDKVTSLATGSHRVCVVRLGSLRCRQPYDPKLPLPKPTLIPGFERNVTAAGGGETSTCAVVSGALKCWDGSSLTPDSITEILPSGVVRLSSGAPQCAILSGGGLKCWALGVSARREALETCSARHCGPAGRNSLSFGCGSG